MQQESKICEQASRHKLHDKLSSHSNEIEMS